MFLLTQSISNIALASVMDPGVYVCAILRLFTTPQQSAGAIAHWWRLSDHSDLFGSVV